MLRHIIEYDPNQLDACYSCVSNYNKQVSIEKNYILSTAERIVRENVLNFKHGKMDDIISHISTAGFTAIITCDVVEERECVYWLVDFLVNPSLMYDLEPNYIDRDIIL